MPPGALGRLGAAAVAICLLAGLLAAAEDEGAAASAARCGKLIQDLASSSYRVRERAQRQLVEIGPPAIEHLEKAAESGDEEVRQRAREALDAIRRNAALRATRAATRNLLWTAPAPEGVVGSPVLVRGAIVFLTAGDKLRAADATTGKLLWELASDLAPGLAAAGDSIYARERGGRLLAVDVRTGKSKPKAKFGATGIHGPATVAGGVIYVRGLDDVLRALDAETGARKWQAKLPEAMPDHAAPVVAGESVYVGTRGGSVCALDRRTGERKWARKAVAGAVVALAVHDELLILRSLASLDALRADTGEAAWHYARPLGGQAGGVQFKQVIVINGRKIVPTYHREGSGCRLACHDGVVCLTAGGMVAAVDAKTGKEKWTYKPQLSKPKEETGARVFRMGQGGARVQVFVAGNLNVPAASGSGPLSAPLVADGVLYFGSREGLHALNLKTRHEMWKFPTPAGVSGRPVVSEGVIYFGTSRTNQANVAAWPQGGLVAAGVPEKANAQEEPGKVPGLYAVRLKAKD